MRSSLQAIFREHFDAFAQSRTLHSRELRAAYSISNCYTAALGGHVLSCPEGHGSIVQYNACHHRSCPRCAERSRQSWLAAELERLLPCEHFHVIFTLPHTFISLWEFNRAWMNQLLFDCARQSLLTLCADPRHLGALPGLLMALHSWGRTLSHHPHVHCLVTAGGVDSNSQWRASRKSFLVPVKPLQHLFRGKLLSHLQSALDAQRLHLPPQQDGTHWRRTIAQQYRTHWNIEISPPYAHGRGVALYLARYVKGGPLSNERTLELSHGAVSFGYTDHHDHRRKTLRLGTTEFIERVLWHAPPARQHTVRRAGLYASALQRQHRLCRAQLTPEALPPSELPCASHIFLSNTPPRCPTCHTNLVVTACLLPAHRFGEYSTPTTHARSPPLGPTERSTGHPNGCAVCAPFN
jgi:hypothetical protein